MSETGRVELWRFQKPNGQECIAPADPDVLGYEEPMPWAVDAREESFIREDRLRELVEELESKAESWRGHNNARSDGLREAANQLLRLLGDE